MKPFLAKYRLRVCLAVFIVSIALFGMSPFSAMMLVVRPAESSAETVLIADSDCGQCYRFVADQWQTNRIKQVLIWVDEPKRLVRLGAIPPIEELARNKLMKDGVSSDALVLLPGISRSNWDTARILNSWLLTNRDQRVRVLCDLFRSRQWAYILSRTLDESTRPRVTVEGVVDTRYDATNWWRRRIGIKTYFYNLFDFAYAYCRGEDIVPDVDWSPENYEATVLGSRP